MFPVSQIIVLGCPYNIPLQTMTRALLKISYKKKKRLLDLNAIDWTSSFHAECHTYGKLRRKEISLIFAFSLLSGLGPK
jgi:hypothetical protein